MTRGEPDARERARPVRWAGVGRPTVERPHGVPPPTPTSAHVDQASASWVCQIVSRRQDRGAIVLTSNRGFGDWNQIFADAVVASAIVDRPLHIGIAAVVTTTSRQLSPPFGGPPCPRATT